MAERAPGRAALHRRLRLVGGRERGGGRLLRGGDPRPGAARHRRGRRRAGRHGARRRHLRSHRAALAGRRRPCCGAPPSTAGRLRVLDFGGSLGSSLRQLSTAAGRHRRRLGRRRAARLRRGRPTPTRTSGCASSRRSTSAAARCAPTVALLSSVLQYLPDPHDVLRTVARQRCRHRRHRPHAHDDARHRPARSSSTCPRRSTRPATPRGCCPATCCSPTLPGWELVGRFPGIEPDGPHVGRHRVRLAGDAPDPGSGMTPLRHPRQELRARPALRRAPARLVRPPQRRRRAALPRRARGRPAGVRAARARARRADARGGRSPST